MPAPLVVGTIAAILTAIAKGIYEIFKFLLYKYGKKIIFGTMFIALYSSVLLIFVNKINSEFSQLLVSLPSNSFSQAGLSLIPNNAITCASIVVSAKIAQMTFYFAIGIARVKFKAQ